MAVTVVEERLLNLNTLEVLMVDRDRCVGEMIVDRCETSKVYG